MEKAVNCMFHLFNYVKYYRKGCVWLHPSNFFCLWMKQRSYCYQLLQIVAGNSDFLFQLISITIMGKPNQKVFFNLKNYIYYFFKQPFLAGSDSDHKDKLQIHHVITKIYTRHSLVLFCAQQFLALTLCRNSNSNEWVQEFTRGIRVWIYIHKSHSY